MFGEQDMFFTKNVKLDDKNRFILPSLTKVEENDELAFFDNNNTYLSLYNLNVLKRELNRLRKLKNKALSNIDMIKYEYFSQQIYYLCSCIDNELKLGKGNRIVIQKKYINKFHFEDSIFIQGVDDHIRIFSNEEQYVKYKNKIKEII